MGTRVPQGASGSVVANYHNRREVPIGAIDGNNTIFTLLFAPFSDPDSLLVFQNGLKLIRYIHYDYAGVVITLITAPRIDDTLETYYAYIL